MYNFGSIPFFASNNNLIEKNPEGIPSCIDAPSLSGEPTPGSTLYVDLGRWENDVDLYEYLWYRGDLIVSSLDAYELTQSDVGYDIKCIITASNRQGNASASTRPVLIRIE
jgi:hypothetical protein